MRPSGKRRPRRPTTTAADPRAIAWEVLRRVAEEGAYADALLGRHPERERLSARDQALLTRLVYGTLAWQGYLDHLLTAFARRPPAALDPPVRAILRLALYQICVLTKVPAFAAVDTAVELAKCDRGGAAVGLVNAVLRRAAASWPTVALPSHIDDPVGHLAVRLSHPRWLVERWAAQYGLADTEALLRADNEPAPTVVRVNTLRLGREDLLARWTHDGTAAGGMTAGGIAANGIAASGSAASATAASATVYSPMGIRLDTARHLERLDGFAEGLFAAQGEASQLVSLLVGPQPGERILDMCAAPGGKTTHLAELMENRGLIVALDSNASGLTRLQRMARRLGVTIVEAVHADAALWAPADGQRFDRVLVDAPCSGLGTLRQHPEVRWRRSPQDVSDLSRLQTRLLTRAAQWVRPGGMLVYATCTLTVEENDAVLTAFLRERPDFVIDDARGVLPESARGLAGDDGVERTFPHRHGLDGFFAVRLKARS